MFIQRILCIFALSLCFGAPWAQAYITHYGNVDLTLSQIDEKGKIKTINQERGTFRLNWMTQKSEIQFLKNQFVYGALDTSQDLINSQGDLIMQGMPQVHFNEGAVESIIMQLVNGKKELVSIVRAALQSTQSERAQGFDLPFYSCGDCENNGEKLILWNAFYGMITREVKVSAPILGSKVIQLTVTLSKLKAIPGSFNAIDNANAGQYGQ